MGFATEDIRRDTGRDSGDEGKSSAGKKGYDENLPSSPSSRYFLSVSKTFPRPPLSVLRSPVSGEPPQ